jgi:hypothetical protein
MLLPRSAKISVKLLVVFHSLSTGEEITVRPLKRWTRRSEEDVMDMDEVTHHRTLDEVQHGVEKALRNFAGNGTNRNEHSELIASERIDKIGHMSALAIEEATETTARDIEQTGQTAVDVATELMNEAKQLATELRGSGHKMSEHLREFATLAKKVSTAMRDTRSEVLGSRDHPLPSGSLLPPQ